MKGLTTIQAEQFLTQYGLNTISEQKKKSIFIKLFEQFNDFLTILLIVAAVFSFLIGEKIDGFLIVFIVVLNAFFGLYQEAKAEESLKALKKMTVSKVRVFRDGSQQEIDSKYLVPGDIVFLEEGVKIPADGKIIETFNLEVNESVLTGESLSVMKQVKDTIFSGTIVTKGRGYFQATKTGNLTKFGQIASSLSNIKDEETPLQKKLADLTKLIGISGIVLSVIVFIISLIEGSSYFPAFLLAISLAVAVVPEGLPAVMTITLAIGTKTMANKKAIVRKLSAIEALGSITLIATDKTGTLTENKMKVKEIFFDNKSEKEISNFKFLISKQFSNFKQQISKPNAKELLILNGILCSTASLVYVHDRGHWDVLGDPTEGALLYLALESGLNIEDVRKQWKIADERPFDSVTKMMSVTVNQKARFDREARRAKGKSQNYMFSKGAPESILNVCKKIIIDGKEKELTGENKKLIENQVNQWASKGLRVLAFSYNKIENSKLKNKNSQKNNIFLGMVAIHDSPRPEVKEAIEKAKSAGIKVVMITGDNEKTAEAIGVNCGLVKEGDEILVGVQLDEYDDEALLKILPRVKIFARTSPFQKHRIVKLFQELGEVVAVTGDGVNDAIALKQADVGVAMGLVGTDVARETADMVITDDNFATIITAIEEGRNIINHLKNAIKYLLSCNMSEAVALVIGLILGMPTLFYPIQLLYINLVTDGIPALILAFSPRDPNLMSITPEKEMVILKNKDKKYILLVGSVGALMVIFSFLAYSKVFYNNLGGTAAFTVLTLIQSFIFIDLWLSHHSLHRHLTRLLSPLFFIAFSLPIIIQFVILSHPYSAGLFKINPAPVPVYLQLLFISSLILLGVKIVKRLI